MLQAFQQKYLAPELARATLVEPSEEAQRAPSRAPADTRAAAPDLNWTTYTPSALDELAQIRFASGLSTTTLPNGLQLVTVTRRNAPIVTSVFGFRVGIGDEVASIAADDAVTTILDSPPPDSGLILQSTFAERAVKMSATGGPEDLDAGIAFLARAVRRYEVEWPSPTCQSETLPRLRKHDATPTTKAYRELASKLFGAHPLGRQVLAGDVGALSKRQIIDFLHRTIAPQNGILVIVGDVRPAQALAAVQRGVSRLAQDGQLRGRAAAALASRFAADNTGRAFPAPNRRGAPRRFAGRGLPPVPASAQRPRPRREVRHHFGRAPRRDGLSTPQEARRQLQRRERRPIAGGRYRLYLDDHRDRK